MNIARWTLRAAVLQTARILTATVFVATFAIAVNAAESKGKRCAAELSACPSRGCAPAGSPEAALNELKRTVPNGGTAVRLTFDDFAELQDQATELVDQKKPIENRNVLRNLNLKSQNRKVAEGDFVEVIGYITGLPTRPKPSGPESVNCRISGAVNNDIHIPLAANAGETEFEGIVVEMIPQNRSEGWTPKKLKRIAKEERPVLVRGQLFYDNMHLVNDDPDDVAASEPKRFSLWELHPVTQFLVCITANKKCNRQNITSKQWKRLEQLPD